MHVLNCSNHFWNMGVGKKFKKAFDFLFRYGNVWWHQHPLMAGSISEIMMLEFFLDTCVWKKWQRKNKLFGKLQKEIKLPRLIKHRKINVRIMVLVPSQKHILKKKYFTPFPCQIVKPRLGHFFKGKHLNFFRTFLSLTFAFYIYIHIVAASPFSPPWSVGIVTFSPLSLFLSFASSIPQLAKEQLLGWVVSLVAVCCFLHPVPIYFGNWTSW